MLRPLCTAKVWLPRYVASLITSLNQKDIESTNAISAINTISCAWLKPCMVNTPDVVSVKRETHVKTGQGEGETR